MYEVARLRSWSHRPAYVTIAIFFVISPKRYISATCPEIVNAWSLVVQR